MKRCAMSELEDIITGVSRLTSASSSSGDQVELLMKMDDHISNLDSLPWLSNDLNTHQTRERKGTKNFIPGLLTDFQNKFPGARVPDPTTICRLCRKQLAKGTVNNCNSKASPGPTHSGRPRTARTPPNAQEVKNVLDRDKIKQVGDANVSPVSSARRNPLVWCTKSSFSRITKDLK